MLNWNTDKTLICRKVRERSAALSIVVKTRDDPEMLRDWLSHHSQLGEIASLIIADNGSTSRDVLEMYDSLDSSVLCFRFDGFHNLIHSKRNFWELHEAFSASSKHYIFVDTDERLTATDGAVHGISLLKDKLQHLDPSVCYPVPWLNNVAGSNRDFVIPSDDQLRINLLFGKPIIASNPVLDLRGHEAILHNAQAPRHAYSAEKISGLFILHLSNLSSAQRIRANRNKLRARGIPVDGMTDNELANLPTAGYADFTIARLVSEIRTHLEKPIVPEQRKEIPAGAVSFGPKGRIAFRSVQERDDFVSQLGSYSSLADGLIGSISERDWLLNGVSAVELQKKIQESRSSGDINSLKRQLSFGLVDFPDFLDSYGHPLFRKELLRLLLTEGEFNAAKNFYPIAGSPGGNSWHDILIARALDQNGQAEAATEVWKRILLREPANGEARRRLTS